MSKRIDSYMDHSSQSGAALAIRVIPRSSRNKIASISEDGVVKIALTAAPVDGKANEALVAFLAEIFDLPRSHIEIVAGHHGRNKLVAISGMKPEVIQEQLFIVYAAQEKKIGD